MPTLTVTYRCIVPSRGIHLQHPIFTIWFDTVPLSIMRGQFPSLAIPREGTPILFPLQNGNGWALQCQTTVGHFLSISRPMIPGLINPKRIISTNNCRLANRQLSSRDGTYISVSCKPYNIHQIKSHHQYHEPLSFPSLSQSQLFNLFPQPNYQHLSHNTIWTSHIIPE